MIFPNNWLSFQILRGAISTKKNRRRDIHEKFECFRTPIWSSATWPCRRVSSTWRTTLVPGNSNIDVFYLVPGNGSLYLAVLRYGPYWKINETWPIIRKTTMLMSELRTRDTPSMCTTKSLMKEREAREIARFHWAHPPFWLAKSLTRVSLISWDSAEETTSNKTFKNSRENCAKSVAAQLTGIC